MLCPTVDGLTARLNVTSIVAVTGTSTLALAGVTFVTVSWFGLAVVVPVVNEARRRNDAVPREIRCGADGDRVRVVAVSGDAGVKSSDRRSVASDTVPATGVPFVCTLSDPDPTVSGLSGDVDVRARSVRSAARRVLPSGGLKARTDGPVVRGPASVVKVQEANAVLTSEIRDAVHRRRVDGERRQRRRSNQCRAAAVRRDE